MPPERKDTHKVEIKSPESPPPVKRPKTEKPHGLSRRTGRYQTGLTQNNLYFAPLVIDMVYK